APADCFAPHSATQRGLSDQLIEHRQTSQRHLRPLRPASLPVLQEKKRNRQRIAFCVLGLMSCHCFGSVRFCQAFEQKASTIFRDRETQFHVRGALSLNFRRLRVKQQLRVRQTQPLLWIVLQVSDEIGRVFGRIHFYEHSGFYWSLQVHCKAEQL